MDTFEILKKLQGNVLLRFPNWIGDAVMASPVLEILNAHLKNADLFIAAPKNVCELFKFHQPSVNLIPIPSANTLSTLIESVRILKQYSFSGAILFQNAFSASLVTFLAGIPFRAGLPTDGRRFLLSKAVPLANVEAHQTDIFCWIAACLTGHSEYSNCHFPRLIVKEEEVNSMKKKFSIDSPYVVVHPGAAYGSAKRWIPERFAGVARALQKYFDLVIVLAGSPSESNLCSHVRDMLGDCYVVDVSGRTSVRDMMALQAGSELVISNDSGPMHTAAAIGVKTIAIFGPTNPNRTAPKNKNCQVIYKKVDCAPCKKRHCSSDHRCMKKVEERDVFRVACQMLAETANSDENFIGKVKCLW